MIRSLRIAVAPLPSISGLTTPFTSLPEYSISRAGELYQCLIGLNV